MRILMGLGMSDTNIDKSVDVVDGVLSDIEGLPDFKFIPQRKILGKSDVINSSKIADCINAESKYQVTARGALLELKEPAFVSSINIYGEAKKVKVFIKEIGGRESYVRGNEDKDNKDRYIYTVRKTIGAIRFESEDGFFKKKTAEIKKVEIFQWGVSDFNVVSEGLERAISIDYELDKKSKLVRAAVDSAKNALKELKEEEDALLKRESELNEALAALEESIAQYSVSEEAAKASYAKAEVSLQEINGRISEVVSREEAIKKGVEEKAQLLSSLIKESADVNARLKEFEKKANLFPDDLKGFADRADKTKRGYYVLAAVPLVILIIFACNLFKSAEALTGLTALKLDEVYSHLIQRLPYVIVVTTIIGGAFAFLAHILRRIEEVHQQEMNLSKISIVARDISDSEYSEGDEDEQKQKRLDLKIRMVQNYLFAEIARTEKEMNKTSPRYQDWTLLGQVKSFVAGKAEKSKDEQ